MIFSQGEIDALRLICWCRYVPAQYLTGILSGTEIENILSAGLVKPHAKSEALVLTQKGTDLLKGIFEDTLPVLTKSYHEAAIQRRVRQAALALTFYRGGANVFTTSTADLNTAPSLFLSAVTRKYEMNPWGNTRVAAIAHLGDTLHAIHYVCPGIGKVVLTDELIAFTNQTARFRDARRAFLFAGESYVSILADLEQTGKTDTKLIGYGDAYRLSQLPVRLLSCDGTGAVQLQIMSVPDYRRKLTQAALKNQYRPPPEDIPWWDALFQGMPFVIAADMDLRHIDAAIQAAHDRGMRQIAIAALKGQAEAVLFPRYRDTGLARVFILTDDAVSAVTGRPPVPYTPPRTQFISPKGDVVDAPPFQTRGKAGGSR